MIVLPTFDSVLVTGSQTIQQDLQVNGNETVTNLSVLGNATVAGSVNVNGSQTVLTHMNIGGTATVGENMFVGGTAGAAQRLAHSNTPTTPASSPLLQTLRFYPTGVAGQPGIQMRGTDGQDYVLFVVVVNGVPQLGIQLA
ncbi:hypothetical protein V3851_15840 [Paenibacillus sp. M1]|uniref:Uncharacterized protein n=1 Tax=Paenibacillus haidiansis TaxID=1574488 RepID=A0ABU7VU64_9BACL